MRKIFIIFLILFFHAQFSLSATAVRNTRENIIVKNKLFSIELPQEFKGFYKIEKKKNYISVFHKASKKAGFGGFAFGIEAYKYPSDYAGSPSGKKLGELKDKNNILFDIVLNHPTDVQYDYVKNSETPEIFKKLYDLGDVINIKGVNGSIYYKDQGTKGKNLYSEILKKYRTAISEKWDLAKLKKENMSYVYNSIPQNEIGYTYYDINGDGIEELLIGKMSKNNQKNIIYDIYTMVDRNAQHVISAQINDNYYVCDNSFICNEHLYLKNGYEIKIYSLIENSTTLFSQLAFKYDKNAKNPYFISYSDNQWENFSKEEFSERKKVFDKYEKFDFIPIN